MDRPRRRERTSRWDKDDRLADLENMDKQRNSNSTEEPPETPVVTAETSKEPSVASSEKKAESELVSPSSEETKAAAEPVPLEPSPPAPSEPTEAAEEAAS